MVTHEPDEGSLTGTMGQVPRSSEVYGVGLLPYDAVQFRIVDVSMGDPEGAKNEPHRVGWDFFVSYSQVDLKWAEWISWQLEAAGYRVLVQAWDMVPGSHWAASIQDGIQYSQRTIAVVSNAYLSSVFGEAEWEAAWLDDPRGLKRRLIPVRVEDCPRPGLLGQVVSIDLFNLGIQAARELLLEKMAVVKVGRAKPVEEPEFPVAHVPGVSRPSAPPAFPGSVEPNSAEGEIAQDKAVSPDVSSRSSPADDRRRGTGDLDGFQSMPPVSGDRRTRPYREAPQVAANVETVTMSLWGSPGSGKTTYLASLPQALNNADASVGQWTIFPNSEPSAELLRQWTRRLIEEQLFPEATAFDTVAKLAWHFKGDLTGSRYMPRGWFRRRLPVQSEFDLDLIDVSGEVFGDNLAGVVPPEIVDTALDHLARARGLIFLFDPITERSVSTTVKYMSRALIGLSRRIKDEGRLIGRYLPHYVAVCIAKFDDSSIFQLSRMAGLLTTGADGMPQVPPQNAERLFNIICEGNLRPDRSTESHGGALFIRNQLRSYFHPDRIRYYATSSIGYKKPLGWSVEAAKRPGFQFDPDDFSNVAEMYGSPRILGPIEPINVLEPLIDLYMQIAGQALSRDSCKSRGPRWIPPSPRASGPRGPGRWATGGG